MNTQCIHGGRRIGGIICAKRTKLLFGSHSERGQTSALSPSFAFAPFLGGLAAAAAADRSVHPLTVESETN
jgi:hypothetical protein